MQELLWARVGELTDRATRLSDLRHHKLHLLAASRMRARGEIVPDELQLDERLTAAIGLAGNVLVRRMREATDARMIVMKGPEVAAHWPSARLRPWKDVDVLVEDARTFQAALLAAGFHEVGDPAIYEDIHHLRPLALPGLPVSVEVHLRPKWPNERPPTFDELSQAAVPGVYAALPDVVTPHPAHHAALLAAHAWEHDPLSRIGSLVDVAALALEAGRDEAGEVARRWGIARHWAVTGRAIDDVLLNGTSKFRTPIWRRHLHEARERTVFEGHVERVVGPLAAGSPAAATRTLARTLRPAPEESWSDKLRRSGIALRHASLRRSDHLEEPPTR